MSASENTPRKRSSCCLIVALCAAIPAVAVALLVGWMILIHRVIPAPALIISEETTRITGPLTADGYIDFLKALELRTYPPELATDENGFRVFVRLFGDVGQHHDIGDEDREFYRLQLYEKLGLDPDVPPTLVLPDDLDHVIHSYYNEKDEERSGTSPLIGSNFWTLEDYPMLADWVNEIDEPLAAIAEAIRKPVFCFPLLSSRGSAEAGRPQNLIAMMLPELRLSRRIARTFQARATYRIGTGNIDGAIDDKLTIHRLGRQVANQGPIVHYLVGIAIEGIGWSVPLGANPDHPLTEQQIRRLLDGLDTLPPLAPFTAPIEWERYWGLSLVQSIQTNESPLLESLAAFSGTDGNTSFFSRLVDGNIQRTINWNVVYRRMNEMYDAAQQPSPRTEYAAIMEEIEKTSGWQPLLRLLIPGGKDPLIANMFIALLAPAVDAFEAAIHRAECMENMQRLALAVLLYELEHGTMPGENWAEQIKPYLGENPERYFSCPANPAPRGSTTYALIQYGDAATGSLLLLELDSPVPFTEAVIIADEVIELVAGGRAVELVTGECCGRTYTYERVIIGTTRLTAHRGGANTAHRSGAVWFMWQMIAKEELLRMLGQEEAHNR